MKVKMPKSKGNKRFSTRKFLLLHCIESLMVRFDRTVVSHFILFSIAISFFWNEGPSSGWVTCCGCV